MLEKFPKNTVMIQERMGKTKMTPIPGTVAPENPSTSTISKRPRNRKEFNDKNLFF